MSLLGSGLGRLGGGLPILATNISVGDHLHVAAGGLTFNLDTLWETGVAMLVVIGLGLLVSRRATSGVPGKLQLMWEMAVDAINRQLEGSVGPRGRSIVPLALALFVFILVANWLTTFEIGAKIDPLGPPTADINLTLALAVIVIVPVHIASIRTRGLRGYVKHYFSPYPFLFPINLVEEIAKPITLALRLFGNLLSSVLMIALLAALAAWTIAHIPIGDVATLLLETVWKLFDLLIGAIQAFIFSLLTILYFDAAMRDAH